MKKYILLVFCLFITISARANLSIDNAYVPAAPPGVMAFAAYLTISNEGAEAREIVGVESAIFGAAHLHHTMLKDGVSSMMSVGSLVINAGETVTLKPGGMHIMLMKPLEDRQKMTSIPLVLIFKNGERMQVSAFVEKMN